MTLLTTLLGVLLSCFESVIGTISESAVAVVLSSCVVLSVGTFSVPTVNTSIYKAHFFA